MYIVLQLETDRKLNDVLYPFTSLFSCQGAISCVVGLSWLELGWKGASGQVGLHEVMWSLITQKLAYAVFGAIFR